MPGYSSESKIPCQVYNGKHRIGAIRWFSARKTELQCVSNGVTSFLHYNPSYWNIRLLCYQCVGILIIKLRWFYHSFIFIMWTPIYIVLFGICILTHCGQGHHMATEIWVNIGSGNGLLPDGTKPLPEPMLTDHQWSPVTFILEQFHKRCLNHQ